MKMDVINVKNLSKSYGPHLAVSDLSFSVKKGQVFGLLGANGAGKTTTIECILGTKKLDSDEATILGVKAQAHRKSLFEKVGVQFQEANYQEGIRVDELCEVTASLYKKPQNYKDMLSRFGLLDQEKSKVKDLSGGQKQRLFIILALLPNPEVVFLDELTTGLDPRARREVWQLLKELKNSGLSILLTSHFMDEVEVLCDEICILKNGKSVFMGTVAEAIALSPFEQFEDAYLWFTDEAGEKNEDL